MKDPRILSGAQIIAGLFWLVIHDGKEADRSEAAQAIAGHIVALTEERDRLRDAIKEVIADPPKDRDDYYSCYWCGGWDKGHASTRPLVGLHAALGTGEDLQHGCAKP